MCVYIYIYRQWRQRITEDLPDASKMYDWNIYIYIYIYIDCLLLLGFLFLVLLSTTLYFRYERLTQPTNKHLFIKFRLIFKLLLFWTVKLICLDKFVSFSSNFQIKLWENNKSLARLPKLFSFPNNTCISKIKPKMLRFWITFAMLLSWVRC